MTSWGIAVDTLLDVTSIRTAVDVTSIVWVTSPSSNARSNVGVLPTSNLMPVTLNERKLGAVAASVYSPGGILSKKTYPASSAMAVRGVISAGPDNSTVAFGTTAPVLSFTYALIPPVVSCADAIGAMARTNSPTMYNKVDTPLHPIVFLFISKPPRDSDLHLGAAPQSAQFHSKASKLDYSRHGEKSEPAD